ncbi:hypothetical protein [Arthrobacter sp. RT-1]|uniref:hypothetical protein n=1 Tax=Arthrobacter sp. RT-1 TaxID=2292263 RepID=UPI0015F16E6C|nr:hypothetical protein [Arthrobacter sp. RT-1]
MQFTTADYLIRSVEAVFVPGAVLLVGFVAALLLHGLVSAMLRRMVGSPTMWLWVTGMTVFAGVVATLLGVWAMFEPLPIDAYLLPPLLQGGGAAVAAYAFSVLQELRRRRAAGGISARRVTRWPLYCYAMVMLLVILNLFWATSMYAAALGTGKAQELVQRLTSRPVATVYSKEALALGPPVREEGIAVAESMFRFKYTRLRLVIQSGGKYFLLSEGWTREAGVAVVLQDTSEIRLELEPGRTRNE